MNKIMLVQSQYDDNRTNQPIAVRQMLESTNQRAINNKINQSEKKVTDPTIPHLQKRVGDPSNVVLRSIPHREQVSEEPNQQLRHRGKRRGILLETPGTASGMRRDGKGESIEAKRGVSKQKKGTLKIFFPTIVLNTKYHLWFFCFLFWLFPSV